MLKSQVNPHFLFNSLNTLLSLIEDDKEMAIEYLESMSLFFRKILQLGENELISLEEELTMIETYFKLQQKRYGEGFQLYIEINDETKKSMIPPLTLQMLVENALKHNSTSANQPLIVTISITENNYITIKNNLQPRLDKQPGTGTGLNNIINRYEMVSDKEVFVTKSNDFFTVALPLILNNS